MQEIFVKKLFKKLFFTLKSPIPTHVPHMWELYGTDIIKLKKDL